MFGNLSVENEDTAAQGTSPCFPAAIEHYRITNLLELLKTCHELGDMADALLYRVGSNQADQKGACFSGDTSCLTNPGILEVMDAVFKRDLMPPYV